MSEPMLKINGEFYERASVAGVLSGGVVVQYDHPRLWEMQCRTDYAAFDSQINERYTTEYCAYCHQKLNETTCQNCGANYDQ
ncbi:MAG: hypothetical protein GY938_32015 [Ketobacter sp.]|nr:hypothetical protein [Ketobacter sp.]